MKREEEIEKRMKEIEEQIKDKQEEIKDEIVPGSYFYDVDKVENLKKEIQEMQGEYKELDETPTIKKVDADLKDLNEKLSLVEEELEEANGSYFLTDDMKELDEQRKELIETIADREETKQILVELEQIEKDLEDLEEEIDDLSEDGAYFIPEDITKEKAEKENRKKELEEKLKDKKVLAKLKDIENVEKSPSKEEQKPSKEEKEEKTEQNEPKQDEPEQNEPEQNEPKQDEPEQDEPEQNEPEQNEPKQNEPKQNEPKQDQPKVTRGNPIPPMNSQRQPNQDIHKQSEEGKKRAEAAVNAGSRYNQGFNEYMKKQEEEKSLKEKSRWDKFKEGCKNMWDKVKANWKKVALALGIGASAIAPTAIPHTEQVTHQGEKIVQKQTTRTEEIEVENDINQMIDNLKPGDILELKGDTELHNTSNMDNPKAIVGHLSKDKQQEVLKLMVTKIKEDKVHFSAVKDEKQIEDYLANGESNLKAVGELNGLTKEQLEKVGTDIGWTDKETLKEQVIPGKHKETRTVTDKEEVKVPYEYTTEETEYTYYARPDADLPRRQEDPMKEETHTGNRVRPGQERAKKEPDNSKDARLERIKRAREKSKNMTQEDMDRLLDEMAENAENTENKNNYSFGDEYRVDNSDNHIEAIAIASLAKEEQENKSVQQEKNSEDITK